MTPPVSAKTEGGKKWGYWDAETEWNQTGREMGGEGERDGTGGSVVRDGP